MSRRSKETLAVQLFPFLAVLVCTMGSLIFLLLVTTREIRQRAVAYAAFQQAEQALLAQQATAEALPVLSIANPEPPAVESIKIPEPEPIIPTDDGYDAALAARERELSDLKATWRLKANLLAKDRDQQLGLLTQRKSLMEAALEKTRSLQSEVKQLEVELGRLAGESAASAQSIDETERIFIEQQIALLKKRLKAAQAADATAQNDQFQVIPFDPQTGTSRRPIFIECTAAGIRFLPEDILITAKDMEGFTHKVNPLAAGTGALVNYWTVWNMKQRQPHSEPEPYVLMLVRPDGVYAYYVAMKMLEPIRTAQGYELIEETTALKLPEVDLGAKTACQTAVNRLLSERENIYRAAVMSGGGGGAVFGGGGTGRRGSAAGKSFGSNQAPGSSEGNAAGRPGGNTFTMNDITGGENAVGSRSWERVENFQGRQRGSRRGDATSQGNENLAEGASNGDGTDWEHEPALGALESSGKSDPGNSRATRSGKKGDTTSRSSANQNGSPTNPNGSQAIANGSPSKRNSFDSLSSGSSEPEPEPGMPIGERPGRKRKPSKSEDEPAADDQLAVSDWDTDSEGAADGEPGGTARSRSGNSSNSSSRLTGTGSSSRFSHDSRNSTRAPRPGEKPSKSNDNSDKPLEPEMLAGRRWGYCDPGAGIGFEREVRVDVNEDKLVIAEKHIIRLGEGESKTEILERFATALDLCSREWGRPPQGFFWAPRLKFVVKPEGNGHYEQVNAMMTRAGLATSHEFAKDARALQFGRANPPTIKPAAKTAASLKPGGYQ